MTVFGAALLVSMLQATAPPQRPVVVASKPFGESYVLAEIFSQLLEARGLRVDRRPGLGATEVAFKALTAGAIDVYPEYTGTGLLAILGEKPIADKDSVFREVSSQFRRRYGVRWLAPLGFQNTYAIAVRRGTADSLHLTTLADLGRISGKIRAGLTADFIGRADGLPGLEHAYGLHFADVRVLGPAVKYQALAAGQVDVAMDARMETYDIAPLIPIIRGAGGVVSTWSGDDPSRGGNVVAASSRGLLEQALGILRGG